MRRSARRLAAALLATAVCLTSLAGTARATDTEQRDFAIFVDGKEVGQSSVKLVQQEDGSAYLNATVNVQVRALLKYTLAIKAQEWWKGGRLVGLKTSTDENGKKTEVLVADGNNNQLKLRVNTQERLVRNDVWTSSFWKLADARYHNKQVPVLDVDTGKDYVAQLQFVGTDQLKVGADLHKCYHFRVTGGSYPIELWFDQYHRLVRQEFTERGHRTIVMLTGVRR